MNRETTPDEIMRTGMFTALKQYLNRYYIDFSGEKDAKYERFFVDTVGLCYHPTYQSILKSEWMSNHVSVCHLRKVQNAGWCADIGYEVR